MYQAVEGGFELGLVLVGMSAEEIDRVGCGGELIGIIIAKSVAAEIAVSVIAASGRPRCQLDCAESQSVQMT